MNVQTDPFEVAVLPDSDPELLQDRFQTFHVSIRVLKLVCVLAKRRVLVHISLRLIGFFSEALVGP